MKGLGVEKSLKFDHFDETKFYSITNKNDILVGDFDDPTKHINTPKLSVTKPIELTLNKLTPAMAAIVDSQGVIEM